MIALIATPIIMNVINDSKKGAAKDSMYSYVKAVELAQAKGLKSDSNLLNGTYTTKDGNLMTNTTKVLGVDMKGTKPSDNGTVTLTNGTVTNAKLKFDGYDVTYDGKVATVGGSSTPTPTAAPAKAYTEGDIIYYNPETNKKCTSTEVNTAVNAKTGCLKWNVITMGDTTSNTTVDIMLDHNTTGHVAWNSSLTNTEMKVVAIALQTDVATWNASVKNTARLITGQEVANIVKNTSWTTGGSNISLSTQSWLYQNLSSGNTAEKPFGYWTSTANSSYPYSAWFVTSDEDLNSSTVTSADFYGVRPVITISKSVIS